MRFEYATHLVRTDQTEPSMVEVMDYLGSHGWELVSVLGEQAHGEALLLFKKPIKKPPRKEDE